LLICNLPHQRPGGSRPKAFRRRTANLFHRKPVPPQTCSTANLFH